MVRSLRRLCRGSESLRLWVSLGMLLAVFHVEARTQVRVAPVWATAEDDDANVDSCAVWVARDPRDSLLFVTEKDGDRLQVLQAVTGKPYAPMPYLGTVEDGTGPGEFNRPNGVWVMYHVPYAGGFTDIVLVTDQRNQRVQIVRLPELEYFGEFGGGQVGKGYGLAPYHDGTDFFVFVTDQEPPGDFPGKIKKYRLRPEGSLLGGDLVFGVGSGSGEPPLSNVESVLADFALDRLHVCGDEGGDFNRLFQLDGTYTGIDYGEPQFQSDQEGINLYLTGETSGYLVVSDQLRGGNPNEFEIFDRETLAPLGYFRCSSTGAIVTRNTDGAFLEQRPLPGFPDGAFFAVNDDTNVHAFDWTDVAEAMGLDIVALDRPFQGSAPRAEPPVSRSSLWFYDGSWWGALERGDDLVAARLEDGTFQAVLVLGGAAPASVRHVGDDAIILAAGDSAVVHPLAYRPSLRRYESVGGPVTLPEVQGPLADLAVEEGPGGRPTRGWVFWVSDGVARVIWSGTSPDGGTGFPRWGADGSVALGGAANLAPCLLHVPQWQATVAVWAEQEEVVLRAHSDKAIPESWGGRDAVVSGAFEAVTAAAAPGGGLFVLAREAGGACRLRVRTSPGAWTDIPVAGIVGTPALVVDSTGATVYLFHATEISGRRVLHRRQAALDDLAFGPDRYLVGWPGVDLAAPIFPAHLPPEASDLVVASSGDDGWGYFGRVALARDDDLQAPITLGHSPPPGAAGVAPGTAISLRVTDDLAGVDRTSVRVLVNDLEIATRLRGVPRSYLVDAELPADLAETRVTIRIEARDLTTPPHAMTPFEYEVELEGTAPRSFLRGEANGDGMIDISDAVSILLALFLGGSSLTCEDSADVDDSGDVDITDVIRLLSFLFLSGPAPADPYLECGTDPTVDLLACPAGGACP